MIVSNETRARDDVEFQADLSLQRLQPRLEEVWQEGHIDEEKRHEFDVRLLRQWRPLFRLLLSLYGGRYDFFYHLEQILTTAAQAWMDRPAALCHLDHNRLHEPDWFLSEKIVGGALYVDLFSENLIRLREHVGYFKNLGLTYLHLMPLFAVRPGDCDGGYAISNYRSVNPLG